MQAQCQMTAPSIQFEMERVHRVAKNTLKNDGEKEPSDATGNAQEVELSGG